MTKFRSRFGPLLTLVVVLTLIAGAGMLVIGTQLPVENCGEHPNYGPCSEQLKVKVDKVPCNDGGGIKLTFDNPNQEKVWYKISVKGMSAVGPRDFVGDDMAEPGHSVREMIGWGKGSFKVRIWWDKFLWFDHEYFEDTVVC